LQLGSLSLEALLYVEIGAARKEKYIDTKLYYPFIL